MCKMKISRYLQVMEVYQLESSCPGQLISVALLTLFLVFSETWTKTATKINREGDSALKTVKILLLDRYRETVCVTFLLKGVSSSKVKHTEYHKGSRLDHQVDIFKKNVGVGKVRSKTTLDIIHHLSI